MDHRRAGRVLVASAAVGLGVVTAWAGDPEPPMQENLAPVANVIRHQDCRFVLVGDSISFRDTAPRMSGAIMRMWQPDMWVGRACTLRGDDVPRDGTSIDIDTDGGNAIITTPTMNRGGVTPSVYSAGHERISPVPIIDVIFAGDYDADKTLLGPELIHTFGKEYNGSDWAEGDLICRLVYYGDEGSWSGAATRGLRSGEPPTLFADGTFDPDGGPAGIRFHDQPIPPGPGTDPRIELRAGGDFDETGQFFYGIEALFYRVDPTSGSRAPGFQLSVMAGGGFQTQHWYKDESYGPPPPASQDHLFTNQTLRNYLAAIHHPNVFGFLIGQNMNGEESSRTLTAFKQRYEFMVDRFIDATVANGQPEPRILMIAPPKAGWLTDPGNGVSWAGHPRYPGAAQAMHELAVERGWAFVNLYALTADAWPTMSHPSELHPVTNDEADAFMSPVWSQILFAPCATADLDDSGDVNVIDLLALLAVWGPCPACEGDQDGDGVIGVVDLLAMLDVWGPCR